MQNEDQSGSLKPSSTTTNGGNDMKRYRVGIVGCGGISRTHMHAYRSVFPADVVAAADIQEDKLKRFSEEYRVSHCNHFSLHIYRVISCKDCSNC